MKRCSLVNVQSESALFYRNLPRGKHFKSSLQQETYTIVSTPLRLYVIGEHLVET